MLGSPLEEPIKNQEESEARGDDAERKNPEVTDARLILGAGIPKADAVSSRRSQLRSKPCS
jgi:hypothetical protein